ncbi:phosphotransferase family protein [Nocardioides zeicaulis]
MAASSVGWSCHHAGVSDLGDLLAPLPGGHSGRTFVSDVAGERTVVRVYPPGDPRGEQAPEVDEAVLRLVRGLVPVPDVLELRRPRATSDEPGLLVTSWLTGERGDLVLARPVDDGRRRALGVALGHVAGTLAGMPFLRPGAFADSTLALTALPGDDLEQWVASRLAHWPEPDLARLREVADRAQDLLDATGRACLVHGDLNPKNVLVDAAEARVVGVVDWEFAHAGHPWTDLGNLVRLDRSQPWVDGVLEGWTALRGGDPAEVLDGARAADLWSLVDLAARAGQNPVADRAEVLLRAVAASGDLHAWPEGA